MIKTCFAIAAPPNTQRIPSDGLPLSTPFVLLWGNSDQMGGNNAPFGLKIGQPQMDLISAVCRSNVIYLINSFDHCSEVVEAISLLVKTIAYCLIFCRISFSGIFHKSVVQSSCTVR